MAKGYFHNKLESLNDTRWQPKAIQKFSLGIPAVAQWKQIGPVTTRLRVRSLASLSGLRIRHCCELWFRLQTWLRSQVAVAVAGSCSSDSTPSLGTSMCCGCGSKKEKKRKEKKRTFTLE